MRVTVDLKIVLQVLFSLGVLRKVVLGEEQEAVPDGVCLLCWLSGGQQYLQTVLP